MYKLEQVRSIGAGKVKFVIQFSLIVFMLVVIGLIIPSQTTNSVNAAAALDVAADIGYRDMDYNTSGVSEPTAQKPQSKLWFNDGKWWGNFYSKGNDEYRIYGLDWDMQVWSDTGVALDDRENSWADVLWDGTHLYVASGTTSGAGRLYRYSYNNGTYSLDSGYPVEVTGDSMEALVFAKDSAGTLWITYTKSGKVYVAHSNGSDDNWIAPYIIPVPEATGAMNDDISSIVAYDGHVGVMWSNQTLKKMIFAVHAVGTADTQWQSVSTYTLSADDHINLKSLQTDSAGNVFAVVKTSFSNVGDPAIVALACTTGDCTSASNWIADTVYYRPAASQRTRPILLIDDTNRELYVFMATSSGGPIKYKKSSIDTIDFSTAPEITFIEYGGSISDPTSTKQNLTGSTGLVVAASDNSYYYHNCLELTGAAECPDPNATPILQFSAAAHDVAEGDGTVTVEVTRIGSLLDTVTVDYATNGGTAVAGEDYVSASNTLTFAPNESVKNIIVNISDDTLDEPLTELFDITLSNPTPTNGAQLGSTITTTITITDDDDPPVAQFGATNYNVGESDAEKTIAVTLSGPSELPITVDYATADDTATANADYTAVSGQLTFAAGVTSQTFVVPILDDNIDEPAEDVALTLTAATNATVSGSATLTIADDDPAPTAQFSATTAVVSEEAGSLLMTVALDKSSANVLSIDYETTDNGTAESGADFGAVNGTLTFNPGETSKDIEIVIFSNGSAEPSETIELKLSNPQNVQLGAPDTAVITILDDDIVPKVEMTTNSLQLDEGVGNVEVLVTLEDASANTIEVTYAVNGGTATAGQDYDALAGTLLFAPGEISKSIMLTILDDAITEADETVQLSITNATYSVPGESNPLTFTIKDNDMHYIYMPMIIR